MADIIQSTTQQFLDIYDITNNYVILKDGTVSVILTVDAMNFGLLAEEEQDAIMYAYAGLLNSLNYPIQIIINSRTKDVTSYLKVLAEQEEIAENETLRRRIRMYREFVGNLIHERNVLDKKFYVVIPAAAVEMGFLSATSVIPGKTASFDISSIERSVIIEKAQNLLDPKKDHLIAQFARIGLYSRQLNTQEIIQLFYVQYNPEAVEGQQIGESSTYTTPLVKASVQGNFMNVTNVVPQPQPQNVLTPDSPSFSATIPEPVAPAVMEPPAQPIASIVTEAPTPVAPVELPPQQFMQSPQLDDSQQVQPLPTIHIVPEEQVVSAPIAASVPEPMQQPVPNVPESMLFSPTQPSVDPVVAAPIEAPPQTTVATTPAPQQKSIEITIPTNSGSSGDLPPLPEI
ncbi:hypothetical protein KA082_02005 [Candidatus Woesebacteria bacterium]|nr:hypothetical protein [Candidatus Woesebacteria bacterium]